VKIAYCSDLHLDIEKGAFFDYPLPDADVLVLAGDISEVQHLRLGDGSWLYHNLADFLKIVSYKYKNVIWVPGNHEHYGLSLTQTRLMVDKWLQYEGIDNIHFGSRRTYTFDDVKFICATLWTDFDKQNPLAMLAAGDMNDYKEITISDMGIARSIRASDIYKIHIAERSYILESLYNNSVDKVVVVTHHAPDYRSECGETTSITPAYCCTDMEHALYNNYEIYNSGVSYWIHGHTHKPCDYLCDMTRVVSNPRGYFGYEKIAKSFQLKNFVL
jgi:predicted phosphodiesterase